jgi:exosortase
MESEPIIAARQAEVQQSLSPGQGEIETRTLWPFLTLLGALAMLWWVLINELRIEWTSDPQYSFGWVVPVLCLGLGFRRCRATLDDRFPQAQLATKGFEGEWPKHGALLCLCCVCAFTILPLRLLLEATPGWRSLNLVLALCTAVLTLAALHIVGGRKRAWHLAFPVLFILVAVPWPHTIEVPLIQGLARADANLVVEVMSILGIPAVRHGNTIEIARGVVGIDDACSGIRSFQSSIMVSLFLGEFYRLRLRQRLLLLPLGFTSAFGFNVVRTTLLTWISAMQGVDRISKYHDEAGVTILCACVAALWAIAWTMQRRNSRARQLARRQEFELAKRDLRQSANGGVPNPGWPCWFGLLLLAWLVAVEVGVEFWYRAHESRSFKGIAWSLSWPPQRVGFQELPIPETSREILKFDEGHAGRWSSGGDVTWTMYYFRWFPGRFALSAARSHNPSICLPASGKQLRKLDSDRIPMKVGNIVLPFRRYEFEESGRLVCVFHCLWEENVAGSYYEFDPTTSQLALRLRAALEGRRNLGQRSIEILINGIEDPQAARFALRAQLQALIQTDAQP